MDHESAQVSAMLYDQTTFVRNIIATGDNLAVNLPVISYIDVSILIPLGPRSRIRGVHSNSERGTTLSVFVAIKALSAARPKIAPVGAAVPQTFGGVGSLAGCSHPLQGLGAGGRFWRAFNPFEQQEFLSLFERYVVLTYSEKLSDYTEDGGCPRVTGSRPEPDGVIVSSQIGPRHGGTANQGRLAPDGAKRLLQSQRHHRRRAQHGGARPLAARRCRRAQRWTATGHSRRIAAADCGGCRALIVRRGTSKTKIDECRA
jgi:hypothetical protein